MLGQNVLNGVHATNGHEDTTVMVAPSLCFLHTPKAIDAKSSMYQWTSSRRRQSTTRGVVLKITLVQNLRHEPQAHFIPVRAKREAVPFEEGLPPTLFGHFWIISDVFLARHIKHGLVGLILAFVVLEGMLRRRKHAPVNVHGCICKAGELCARYTGARNGLFRLCATVDDVVHVLFDFDYFFLPVKDTT